MAKLLSGTRIYGNLVVDTWANAASANISGTTTSTSATTGALQVAGGVGIAGNLNVGTNLVVTGNLTVNGSTNTINNTTIETTEYVQTIDATTVRAVTIGNSGATLTGTLSTAAQTNITTVGNLTALSTAGTITSWGNIVAASGTASTSTSTGALVVTGGAGISGAVYAGSLYDNGVRVVSTSSGAGNLTISAGAITLPATGPGASTVGSSSSIPVITTDAYGRIVALTSSAISTSFTASGTSGTTTISGGSTLSFASTNGVTIAVGATYANISTPQDVRTSASPTFASGTFNGTIIAATLNAVTIGNISANVVGTGTYLTSLAAPNVIGTVTTANVSLYDSVTAYTTNQTFYPSFSNISITGNTTQGVAPSLAFNPGTGSGTLNTGTLVAITVNAATIGNAAATGQFGTITATTVNAATIGNIGANHVGTGTYLTSLSGSNVTGTVASATTAQYVTGLTASNVTTALGSTAVQNATTATYVTGLTASNVQTVIGSVSTASFPTLNQNTTGTAATVTTAAQPNITSVGTLTSLAVGAVTSSGTIIASAVNAATIGNSGATLTGTLSTASQPNVTTLAGLTSFGTAGVTTTAQGNLSIAGNLTVTGNSVSIGASTLSINDPIINLNTASDLTPLTVPTTADIGLKFHYYDSADSAAFLGRTTTDGYLTWWAKGSDTANVFTGTVYGTVKTGALWLANTTTSTSTTTGALRVDGGAGIAGNVNVGGNITQAGYHVINSNIGVAALQITGTATKGGAGYHDFLSVTNQGGGTNPNKWFRMNNTGNFEIINSAYTTNLFTLTDDGNITIPGKATVNALYTTTGLFWAGNNNVISTGGATPAGLTGQVQYNNGGALGATALYYFTGNSAHITTGNITAGQFYSTNNGNGTNYAVGDDVWLGDINIANTMGVRGQQDATQGYIVFGNTNNTNYIGRTGSNPITVTGAFATTGNTDVQSTLYGRGVYDNGTRVASTSGGPGNLSIVTGNITMSLTGPGAVTTGGSTAIPVITTDAYGRISTTSTAAVVAPAGTLSGSTLNSGVTASSLTSVGILTGLTTTGTIIASTLNAATIGNSGATLTGTLSTAAQTNITSVGTLTSLNVGAVTSSGTIIASTVQAATIGNTNAVLTGSTGTFTSWANITGTATSTSTTTGALVVGGGVGISGALNVGANVTVTGNVLPSANVTYSLGSATQRWKDLWLSGSTIDLSGATIKTDATTGAVAIIPNPTATNPNPSGIVISPAGTVSTVTTTAGVPTAGAISNVSNVATTSSTSTFANANVTSNTASTSTTTGALIVAGGTGIAGDAYIGGNVNIANRSYAKFSPTGSVYWIGLRSPSSVTANVIFNLPSADGTAGQFLKTDGAGNWSFAAGGSGGSSGFAVSTITTHPAASGDKRLGTGADNTTDETPFASGGTDAFGVSLGIVYDQMEPTGTTVTVEMGSAVSI
jgi:hypothetical protein